MILLRLFIRSPFEIRYKEIDTFFVNAKGSLPVKELAGKNTLLACTLLIYNQLLRYEHI